MKLKIYSLYLLIFFQSFAQLEINNNPLIFKDIRIKNNGIYKNKAKARGIITIKSNNLKEDFGKLIEFKTPKYIYITNGKKYIRINKINFENKFKKIIISQEITKVIYHVILDKKEFSNINDNNLIEGLYTGTFPIHYSIYTKEL